MSNTTGPFPRAITEPGHERPSGPKFPRPHYQRLDTQPGGWDGQKRLATGSIAPPLAVGTVDEEFLDEEKTPVGPRDGGD